MAAHDLIDRYVAHYEPLVTDYLQVLHARPASDYQGIPDPFLPAFGTRYEESALKLAIVGLDTAGWGHGLTSLIERLDKEGPRPFLSDMTEFQNLDYVSWTRGHRYTFWGFAMYFLAALYGVKDWEILKQRKHSDLLKSFVWGNVNAVELWQHTPSREHVKRDAWKLAYKEAHRRFDGLSHILGVFVPDAVVIMAQTPESYFTGLDKQLIKEVRGVRIYRIGKTFVFCIPHPNRMKFVGGADYYARTIRQYLLEEGLTVEMKEFSDLGVENKALREMLIGALAKGPIKPTREAAACIAAELRKHDAKMTVRLLCEILNTAGCRTQYGSLYAAGRGSYRMLGHAYDFYAANGRQDLAEAIALAFTRSDGSYAYEPPKGIQPSTVQK